MCMRKDLASRMWDLDSESLFYRLDVYSGPIQFGDEDGVDRIFRGRGRFYQFAVTVFERK